MGGLMNNYYYGKAGKGDYTVDQMPTTRRQLFFTTLRVRLSSMCALNFFHLVFLIPILILALFAYNGLMMFTSDDAWKMGSEDMQNAYHLYMDSNNAYRDAKNAEDKIEDYKNRLEDVVERIDRVKKGEEIIVEDAPVVEGGEPEKRPVTMEELEKEKAGYEAEIARFEKLLSETDEAKMEELRVAAYTNLINYESYRSGALKSFIAQTLLFMIPLIGLAGIGSTGQMYVLRNWARDEHAFLWQDYKNTIKSNWKQGFVVGIINGLSLYLSFIAFTTYGSLANNNALFLIPQWLMVMLLFVWWMVNEVIFAMMVTYDMKLKQLIRNSVIMVLARLPIAALILIGSLIVPVVLAFFVPPQISFLALIVIYGVIGFSLTGFVYVSFANSCFDKFLNPRIEGAEVNKGLYKNDDYEDEEELPKVEMKEDRFWEHKS